MKVIINEEDKESIEGSSNIVNDNSLKTSKEEKIENILNTL